MRPSQGLVVARGASSETGTDPKSHSPHARPLPEDTEEAGLFSSNAGGHGYTPGAFYTFTASPRTMTVNPAQGTGSQATQAQRPSLRKRHWFGHFHGFMSASDMLELWPCLEMNSGAQTFSHVFPSKPTS